jgi:hypothetical protein
MPISFLMGRQRVSHRQSASRHPDMASFFLRSVCEVNEEAVDNEDGTIKLTKPLNADQLRRRSERQATGSAIWPVTG